MAKKKPRNRANKVKGRLPTKKIKFSDSEWDDIVSMAQKYVAIDNMSCFEISLPCAGAVFSSNDGLSSLSVEQCSERDELTGDFQVSCSNESGQKLRLTAKQWANNLVTLGH